MLPCNIVYLCIMTSYAQKFTTKPQLHEIIHIVCTLNAVHTWVFITSLFLWDSFQPKIYKTSLIFEFN